MHRKFTPWQKCQPTGSLQALLIQQGESCWTCMEHAKSRQYQASGNPLWHFSCVTAEGSAYRMELAIALHEGQQGCNLTDLKPPALSTA
eukprot:scaffold142167_cov28-Tisochrysis_lutea.AAC.1